MNHCISRTAVVILLFTTLSSAQNQQPDAATERSNKFDFFFNYLNMAGTRKASDFQPLSQEERTHLYLKTLVNPLSYIKAGLSAGIDQWNDKPEEWEQGASGYGKRFANILGQDTIQRAVEFGMSSALHEDNRYFNSGKQGFWPRIVYAVQSTVLARRDDGSRTFSFSQIGGVAAGAFLSRLWQPPSQHSAESGAVSFGITMGSRTGFSVVKEFIPDLARALGRNHKK